MGIRGLFSYISERENKFLEDYELHDTHLVIDGYSVVHKLLNQDECDFFFGGDYKKFEHMIFNFFDDLLLCKVKPIIIYDGAPDDRKLSTIELRAIERIKRTSKSTPINQLSPLPILATEVFRNAAKSKNIKMIQSTFGADDHIASIAKLLGCPVLSFDSDFYIYDVLYIPINTLRSRTFKHLSGSGFVKYCKIFKSDFLIQNFPNLKKELLPLASVILGNDYIDVNVFKNFITSLKVEKKLKQKSNKLHLRIETVLKWLSTQTLDSAITNILKNLDQENNNSLIEAIEMIVNGYFNIQTSLLGFLEFSTTDMENMIQRTPNKTYRYNKENNLNEALKNDEKKLDTLITNEKKIENDDITDFKNLEIDDESYLSWDEALTNSNHSKLVIFQSNTIENFNKVPEWFMQKYNRAEFPSYFMDLIYRQLIGVHEQVEDYNYPTCFNISLKIFSVIFRLLNNGITNCDTFEYIARGEGCNIKKYEFDCKNYNIHCEIPSLEKMITLTVMERRKILTCTLGVSNDQVMKFPPNLRVYVATIKYWLNEADKIFTTSYHLTALVIAMIYHIIRKVIKDGPYPKNKTQNVLISGNMNIKDSLSNITKQECILAAKFYENHFHITNVSEFNKTVIHGYSLFQNCLKYSMHLNKLLGHPYQSCDFQDLFISGTLNYNLYNYLKNFSNLNGELKNIFSNSPSIHQLVVSILTEIEKI